MHIVLTVLHIFLCLHIKTLRRSDCATYKSWQPVCRETIRAHPHLGVCLCRVIKLDSQVEIIAKWKEAIQKISLLCCEDSSMAQFTQEQLLLQSDYLPAVIFLCCCCWGSMGLVFRVTVVIPEGGESGVFGKMGVGCPVGVPWGDVFVWICALMAAPPADCMWVIGTKLPGIWEYNVSDLQTCYLWWSI